MKSKKRQNTSLSTKKRRKLTEKYLKGGGASQYALKKAYCDKHGVWGFEVKNKPWKKAAASLANCASFVQTHELSAALADRIKHS